MIVFPNAKINLGLNEVRRRADGYHDLDMVMMPVGWSDVLEVVPAAGSETTLTVTGRRVECPMESNLVYKAFLEVQRVWYEKLPPVDIFLHKVIPDGAGLGGGSSDAAFTIKVLNDLLNLKLCNERLEFLASRIGADCPFFIDNRSMHCTGIGDVMRPVDIYFGKAKWLLIAKPLDVSVSTAEAYRGVKIDPDRMLTAKIVSEFPAERWRGVLENAFEHHILKAHPEIAELKEQMYEHGAVYASMSGSGSAVYGLFESQDDAESARESLNTERCATWCERLPQ